MAQWTFPVVEAKNHRATTHLVFNCKTLKYSSRRNLLNNWSTRKQSAMVLLAFFCFIDNSANSLIFLLLPDQPWINYYVTFPFSNIFSYKFLNSSAMAFILLEIKKLELLQYLGWNMILTHILASMKLNLNQIFCCLGFRSQIISGVQLCFDCLGISGCPARFVTDMIFDIHFNKWSTIIL